MFDEDGVVHPVLSVTPSPVRSNLTLEFCHDESFKPSPLVSMIKGSFGGMEAAMADRKDW